MAELDTAAAKSAWVTVLFKLAELHAAPPLSPRGLMGALPATASATPSQGLRKERGIARCKKHFHPCEYHFLRRQALRKKERQVPGA